MLPEEIKDQLKLSTFTEQPDLEELMKYNSRNTYALDDSRQHLIGLNLRANQLKDKQLDFLQKLQLQALNLSENELSHFLVGSGMFELRYLNISETPTLTQVELQEELRALEWADLSECKLTRIKLSGNFAALRTLYLQKNQLKEVLFTGSFPLLKFLDISENKLTTCAIPASFEQLAYLYLNDNQLESVALTSSAAHLEVLHLRNNKLKALPANFLTFSILSNLYLHNNPLPDIPKETIPNGERDNALESIQNYLRSLQKGKNIALREAKMILVGNGEVGKTSIRVRLIDPTAPLPKKEERTPGLDIGTYVLENLEPGLTKLNAPIDFRLNIWDFGGQGKYREIQQLFCSRKSLYLFVTAYDDTAEKEDYCGFEYWLSMVNAYSYDETSKALSPVIHILNKIDERKVLIDEHQRHAIFPNIHGDFIKISCKTLENFSQLRAAIKNALPSISADIFTGLYAGHWLQVKGILEKRKKENHITYQEYERICWEANMDKGEAKTWIEILDRIGVIIYFGNHPELKDWIILNPEWVKEALFKVLDSPYIDNGVLNSHLIEAILPAKTDEERQKLLGLMKAYKLSYEQMNGFGKTEYIIPALLSDHPPRLPEHLRKTADFYVKFLYRPFLPAGTVNKLMVYLKDDRAEYSMGMRHEQLEKREKDFVRIPAQIFDGLMWKNNVVIFDPSQNAYAQVKEVWEDHAIFLDLFGTQAAHLFSFISELLQKINDDLKQAKYLDGLKLIAYGWHQNKWIELEVLEALGADFFQIARTSKTENTAMEQIQLLIAQGHVKEALDQLVKKAPAGYKNDAILLQSQFNNLKSEERIGILNSSEKTLRHNQLNYAILNLIDSISSDALLPADEEIERDVNPKQVRKSTILFLAANPIDGSLLQTDREHRLLVAELERGRFRDNYEFLPPKFAVTTQELLRAMNDNPKIIHFSGHGTTEGICVTNEENTVQILPTPAIQRLFRTLQGKTEIVILNACYSAVQAKTISEFGIFVVGNKRPITDKAAIRFSEGFYNGLGEGKSFEDAFNDGMIMVMTHHSGEADMIEVWKDGQQLTI